MADKDNKSKLTYHVWDKDNNEYDIPDEVVQQRGMDNFAKDFEGGYITMFDDKKQKVDVPIEDVGEYRKQGYMWYDTSGNATPINEVGKKPSPSKEKEQSQYPQEKPGLISQALGMMPKVDAGNIGREQKVGGMIANLLLGDNMQQPQDNNQQVQQPNQENAPSTEQPKPTAKDVDATTGAAPVQQVDAIYNKYVGKGDALSETMYDLMASGQAQNQEEAQNMAMGAMNRAASRLAQRTTDEFVSKLGDTVEGVDEAVMNGWHSHAVQDNLKKMASQLGIMNSVVLDENGQYITHVNSYDQFINGMVKPAMVESLVKKYGENYRKIAEDLATRLYSNDEVIQNQLMNQDIDEALSDVISKYVNPSVVDEYNKAQEEGSKAFNEGMEGSQYIPANLRLGTALGAQYEANQAKDPQKILSRLMVMNYNKLSDPKFRLSLAEAATNVALKYHRYGEYKLDPDRINGLVLATVQNQLDRLEVKNMIPKGSAEYIMKSGLGNTIIGKVSRKIMQTDYQNWLEDIANQQYQPGFWENVASGSLTFAGDAWSYWLPGAAGGKLTKSMVAKAEGKLAGDLMAKGMERKMAERAAKVLIGKSKAAALKSGAAHGAVTFGGQSAISKPIDEIYRTGQLDENGMIYNPSVGKVIANTLGEVAKQSAVGAIMQGGTIANMVGKGRGLATNILADVGGKVVDSGIMTGHQLLERMAQDPNFKPTGKDAVETFLESGANLLSIGFPGFVGKYARFKDAKEFNKKFDFTDQDIAELKRFGYDSLRDAFEKVGINGYRAEEDYSNSTNRTKLPIPYAEETQVQNLTQKYMDLMNDKSVPEVLKAKMMAVVEGKRPSSFSPVVDSVIVQPMDQDGKVYLETLNKDGGIIDRKEFSSLDEAQKAEKKLEYEKTLGLASVLEGEFHKEFTQEHLEDLYNQAAQKYYIGYKLTDEEKAAVYLRQNAGTIAELIHNRQNGIILTDEEQKQVDTYRHFYDSALENSSVLREFVQTFEDSHGVARGTLRKALESKDKKYAPLVESYLKELYNSIELKREMKDTKEQMNQTEETQETTGATQEGGASAQNAEATAEKPVDASVSSDVPPTEPPTPPVGGETPSNADDTPSVENNVSPSDADTASNESKSDAYVMGQNAYRNGDAEGLKAIDHNDDVSKARLKRAFADDEAKMNVAVKAYEDGKDMEQFIAQRANSMTTAQQDAVRKYVEAQDAKKGAIDALQHADDGYAESLKQQLSPYTMENGNIFSLTLTDGQRGYWKSKNDYGAGFGVFPDANGKPVVKQVYLSQVKEEGKEIPLQEYVNELATQKHEATKKNFEAMFDATSLKPNDTVSLSINDKDQPTEAKIVSVNPDGTISFNIAGSKNITTVLLEQFNKFQHFAQRNGINAELDAEDAQRAENEAIKAEADKKQRYANGIVGLSEGQPDYSSKDSDPNVAAEYLQEQFGEDHGKLLNLVNGSRDDIKTQLANKRKAAAEYQNWLDTNADLDPEKAKKVENELSLVNEQIADLDARFKNWNTIRNSVMTPDEVKAMKEERKAEIERAGIDKSSVLPDVDTGVRIPENSELKDKYPTQEAASSYITSERRRVYKMQEETQREIDGVDKILNQYMDGDMELSAEQLRDLNTTKAELANRQNALTADAKALKGKAESLNILYIKERAEQNKKNLEALSPKDRRKELVAKALEKKDMKAIKEIYKDASTDVMDLTPRTLEEFVSERLFPHSLNAESLAQELGSSNFRRGIGSKYDTNKFNYLLANNGEGLTISELAKRVWEDLSGTMESGAGDGLQSTYTDQDIRNTILDMFKTYDSVREMRNVTLLNRIAAAENELSGEEEWYEQQKEREIFEKQKEIDEYKSYIHDKELSLPSESELDHINGLEFDRMMEIEDREREYKQYVKSILPELADYDDRSNEEGYGGGSSLGSDSSRRGVDEGNSQGEEVGNGEASSESEIGEGSDSGRKGRQETGSLERGESPAVRGSHLPQEASFGERLKNAIAETETEPTEAQKKAGNYKKGHLSFGGYDYTVETPKGVTRSGKDEQGKPWSVTMHDTYGYILGKIGVDGDHIDMFINDAADLDTFDGNVYVVDQVNPETGEFDEHKVMYGYPSEEAATEAYLANYSKGWKGLGKVTSVPKATFDKWLESSDRKTKPFADYAMVQKEQAKFDRDVKEVKPSEMTEAQKVAYDAVSTMLKKAGIPVKVVSNEDMEKVAEAQDNLNLAMLLNQPEMRFKIKTPEEKQAAENAYNFAKELRPDKWKQYAVVNMSNPNKKPEYFEKQELARKERSYYNKLMWGNYKVFNLDKSFEDNVAGLTGSFPSEFDPYKIDEQTNKKNELKRQIKETEDAYNSTGQERNKYQIQLMKEYMDEHGLTSENDIPDDVWSDLNDKAHEKYQDKLDSLFAKYKDLDRQLKAVAEPGVKFLRTYHGSGASFDKFDLSHALEGEGSETFGHGVYVTSSREIGREYAQRAKQKKMANLYKTIRYPDGVKGDTFKRRLFGEMVNDVATGGDVKSAKEFAKKRVGADANDVERTLEHLKDREKGTEYEQNLKDGLAKYKDALKWIDSLDDDYLTQGNATRYEVEIPEDNGSNYIDWKNKLKKSHLSKVNKELVRIGKEPIETIYPSRVDGKVRGQDLYDELSAILGSKEAASKLLSDAGFVGIKYPAGTIYGGAKEGDYNYVIFDENNAQIVDHTKFAQGKGVVYGYTDGKEIVLNQEHLNPNTPIHEYQHLWRTAAKNMNPELIEHGDKLIMQTQLFADLKQDPNYNHLTDEQICDEAFARLTGEDGAAILEQMAKDAIKENPLDTAKELSVINKLKEWLKKFWYWTLDTFTKWKPEDIKKMTLEDIRNLVLRDLANGVDPRNVKSRMTKEDAVSLRKQMADNAEQERILEHTEENWLKEFGKDSRVTTPIGSIKLGENQYKKAGRNDRIKRFGLLKPTLERPDVILEKSAPKEGAERQTKYLFIKSFKKADGNKILNYESITVKQGEEEVAISAHQIDPSKVLKELTESKVLWNRFRGDSNSLGENQGSALTPSANNPSGKDSVLNPHSDANIRNNIETTKGNGGNLSVEDKIKAVSQQFGVDEADVAMYANAVKKGSTAEAARARANIKRHLLQANEDKISSLKELLKYTVPVNNALKENFGDLDAMIEERVKQVEAQRNAMEAARKRAEEEEAKRQKHLEELSVIPDDQLDKQYMDALAKGDDATAREMLDEAARRKGYDDTESAYQGVGAWAAPGNPGYESDKARRDDWESSGSDVNLEDMALGYTPQPDDYFSHPERYSQNTPHGLESVKAINVAIDAIKNGEKDVKVKVYRAVPTSVKEGKLRNGDWVTPSKKYAEMHGTNRLEGKYRIIEDEVPATQLWWDGNDANEFGFDDGKEYKYKNAKNNRKLNDLVTYDDKGDVIPPSKRFNSRKSDIRFMFAGEKGAAEADKAEEKTYRMDNLKVAEKMERGKKANVMPRLGSATIGLKAAKDKVVELFNKAKSGEFNGKPQSIGILTQEGKKFLEDLSGLKMKDKIDFVLNPSDLKHMNKDHFGDNEKDPGRNIPLTEEDLRSMVDVIMNPEQVVYGIEKMDNRKAFFFLKQAEDGTLNLAEIYSDKKGNLTAKSYYKTKKGVDQRVMEIKNSLLPTPEASSGSPLSDGKGINFFSIEQEKTAETAENERKIADSVVNTANKLGGAEATVYSSLDDVPEEYRSEVEQGAKGWYDPETHTVHVYLPNCEDGNDAQRTVLHEKIGHEGMEVLLGGEDGVRKFANFVYRSVGKDVRGKVIDFANKYDPDWKNPDRMNVGTQEYIARLAEEGPKTAEDFTLWTKIKHYLIKVLKKLGIRVPGLLNDKDLRYYLMKAGKALHVWDNMPKEKQEAMMKQANNAEIKDSLGEGAGKKDVGKSDIEEVPKRLSEVASEINDTDHLKSEKKAITEKDLKEVLPLLEKLDSFNGNPKISLDGEVVDKKSIADQIARRINSFHILDANYVPLSTSDILNEQVLPLFGKEALGSKKYEDRLALEAKLAGIKTERGRIDEATGAFKLAPNGEQSNLSKKQYIEARTKKFKDWFGGDWEKKPKDFKNKLDANGEPLEKYVEGYLNRPKKPTMPKKRKGEDEATFFERKMLYSQALEDWPKTEADWKKRIDEFDENTLAALTPPDEEAIREKYQKQYENDMASWRKDHPNIEEGEERPQKIPDMRDYQSIQDYGEALGKHEIWKTAPNKDEYERMAEDEIISKVALMDAVLHPFSNYARMKAMNAEFQHMRHVMQNQKVYDKNTANAVVQFAKRFMSLGYGDNLGRGSINKLLGIVKNSVGQESRYVPQRFYEVMDTLMDNQLRNLENAVMKTMSIKELKENAKGIQVQGKLELRGQTTIKAFRDAIAERVSSDKLDERISNLLDKMADDKENASSYQDELLGLNLAKQYVDYIDSSRVDASDITDMKKKEIKDFSKREGIYKDGLNQALRQEHLERLNSYNEAIFNNKLERMERYSQLLANLGGMIDESVKGAKEFQERDARRAIKVKMMASADLGDKSMNQHHKENWKTRLSNSDVVRFLGSPLGSFDALMREFGSKQINGEGQLWNHFVRGAMKASNDEFKSVREANNEIDLKVSELFGKVTEDKDGNKKGNMILNDLYALERSNKVKSLDVTIRDIEGEQTYKLQQGNLMYIYMVNKMPDGAMKLRQMGILDADVERIKENIDPRFLKLADWIQGEFLPKMRTKYNKRHEELFGAPMPMVENYFPLRVLKNARYMEEDVNNTSDGSNAMPSTATGAIIKRKINKLPLDILNADALSVTIDNINEMENWYNYAPIRKDANTLLSDTAFRNRVQNMTTIYGSGERLWNNVKDATAVAMGTYRPKGGTDLAVSLKNFGKGITGAKISGRLYTAFKQILSAPLFLPDADLGRFVRYSIKPYSSFKWAIENMPNFDKRWSGRKLGDTVLMDDPTDWKIWHTNLMEKAAYYGMTPNALVDAVTCAVGARAVYDTKYKQYIKAGLTEERAREKALSDAEINFNTSQQSSEGVFVSPMQLDRTLESAIFTPFRNSSMLYERKGINALRNLKHRFEKGHKEASIKYMAAQLMEEGVGYEQATKAAEKMYQKGLMHNIADAIVSLWLGPIIWNLGGSLGYLIPYLGDDENKKKKMGLDAVILGLLEGPVDGLAGGQFINTAIANTITSDGISLKGLKNVDFSGMPMLSDFSSMIEKFGYDKVAGVQDLMFMVMQSSTGFNPKTLTDAINACIDYGHGDMTNAKEIALFVFRLMNGPASTVDNLYIDELGMKGKDAKKLSYEELAKRYAEYKFGKNTFGFGKLYSDEEKQKKLKAIEKSFDEKVSERLAGMDREDLKNEYSESRSQKEKKLIGKIIADELETKDSEAVKKAKADASYLRQRNFSDLMDDLYLQKEWETTNAANAGLEELKDNGASEKEIEAYKTKHKADLDKRKAIQKARKEMQKKKADISSDNDDATMAEIRKLRDSILKTVRQTKK